MCIYDCMLKDLSSLPVSFNALFYTTIDCVLLTPFNWQIDAESELLYVHSPFCALFWRVSVNP